MPEPARFFNTAGPVNCADHYCLPPLERFDLENVLTLIAQKKYFVLHAPRQTGKTSCLLALAEHLQRAGQYQPLYLNVEIAQSAREDVGAAMQAILGKLAAQTYTRLGNPVLNENWRLLLEKHGAHGALEAALALWAESSSQPVVLMLDEIDALVGDTLISVLRQLRAGYTNRPAGFPQSVALCGVRDVRDYRIHSSREKAVITGGSAFNIKAESLRLGDFSRQEMEMLYRQHTDATAQAFSAEALSLAWELTRGQPWLVNALAYEACFKNKAGRDRSQAVSAEMFLQAKENLIARRETHLDQLADKLREPRVRRVIEAILVGRDAPEVMPEDDLQYVADLGLVRRKPEVEIANRIYQEIIPRELTSVTQDMLAQNTLWYIRPDGRLDLDKLLSAFQQFFREHSEHWVERFDYQEAGPQLLLQAFLQRVVNGGGRIEREYGLGRLRTDLLVLWPVNPADTRQPERQRVVIELKILYGSLDRTLAQGLEQTWDYLDRCAAAEAHLIIFDRRAGRSWDEKIFRRVENYRGAAIKVWGM